METGSNTFSQNATAASGQSRYGVSEQWDAVLVPSATESSAPAGSSSYQEENIYENDFYQYLAQLKLNEEVPSLSF